MINGETTHNVVPLESAESFDERILKAREDFFAELTRRRRAIKRHWLELNAVTNSYFLQLLPYRSLLDQVSKMTCSRKEALLSPIPPSSDSEPASLDFYQQQPLDSLPCSISESPDSEETETDDLVDLKSD